MSELLNKVDTVLHVKKPSGKHVGPSVARDFETILNTLLCEKVFDIQEGRAHRHFKNISCDPFSSLKKSPKELQKWLVKRRRAANIEHQIAKRNFKLFFYV